MASGERREDNDVSPSAGSTADAGDAARVLPVALEDAEFWRSLIEQAPIFIVLLDREGRFTYANFYLGPHSEHTVLGRPVFDFVSPEQHETMRQAFAQVLQTGEPFNYRAQDRFTKKWYNNTAGPFRSGDKIVGIVQYSVDITREHEAQHERRQAEETLRESEARLRLMVDQIPAIIWTTDANLCFMSSMGNGLAALRLEPNELRGVSIQQYFGGEDPAVVAIAGHRRALAGESVSFFFEWEGNAYQTHVEPLRDARGTIVGTMGVALDITARRRAEVALRAYRNELEDRVRQRTSELDEANRRLQKDIERRQKVEESLRNERRLLKRLLDLHERERQLIAYEIHDGFVQDMTAAVMFAEANRDAMSDLPSDAARNYEQSLKLLRDSIDEARRMIRGLRPAILDEEGVVAAVENLAEEMQAMSGIAIEFRHDVQFDRIAPTLEMAIYRIVQEALNNVRKHSHSPKARVEIAQRGDRVHLRIEDWGQGFDTRKVKKKRYGLTGVRERARLLGGKANIESEPGKGTRIEIELPLADVLLPVDEE